MKTFPSDLFPPVSLTRSFVLAGALLGVSFEASSQLLWSDEFDSGSAPNSAVWSYDLGAGGWGNSELQTYTNDAANVRVEGGNLIISAQEQILKGGRRQFTSARVKTENKLTFKYGTIEARIKTPNVADGLWPAFWTLGNNFGEVGWPDCGELDVMEMGSAAAISEGVVNRRVSSTAHWEHNGGHANYGLSFDYPTDLNGSFHVYRMEWTPTEVSTYIDDNWIWTIDISSASCTDCTEFHQPHFFILNMAVGGTFTGLTRANDISAPIPAEMVVDYVRISDNGYTVLGGSSLTPEAEFTHVDSIVPGSSGGGPNKKATADVIVLDETGAPVDGATVTATFSGSHNETISAVTDANGEASLITTVKNRSVMFQTCVDDVSHSSMTYDSGANLETCDNY
ncbi:family 16 glycosylhydrolase [Pseudomaricurvus alkylphenolicus]|uniref:family 16 glycosylhydrolase n=1 Tax=Pseudomaricurvus alkylphenolicus TaxID=1306991 RepID=UPI0014235863|nr:family 16 glycosylhydrolase [Pseudomaricurvus alkylphenolicus]NIB42955.1 family 16 glycosylhydrolase [Pseudomaricurvus alkylphenolicus]